MANQWFKFYGGDYLADPKMGALNPVERSCWLTLMSLASMATEQGVIGFLTVEVLLNKSGITFDPYHPEEWNNTLGVLKKFESMGMVELAENGQILLKNWAKRQDTSLTNAERQARFRAKSNGPRYESNARIEPVTKVTLEENRIEENKPRPPRVPRSSKPTFQSPLVSELVKAFEEVDPKNKTYYNNTSQRKACDFLIAEYGLEEVLKRVKVLPKTNTVPFFPSITTPVQLRDKWVQLQDAVQRKRGEAQAKKTIIV